MPLLTSDEDILRAFAEEHSKMSEETLQWLVKTFNVPIHSSADPKPIKIKKSPSADTRTATHAVTKEELLESTLMHISDVQKALSWFANKLIEAGSIHDHTKINDIDGFYKLAQAGFKDEDFRAGDWFKKHVTTERHHLTDHCPDDVTLIDVMERVADMVSAGLARSGSVYEDDLDPAILRKAYINTINLLKEQIEVEE